MLWQRFAEQDLMVWERGITAGDPVTVRPRPGQVLSGRFVLPDGMESAVLRFRFEAEGITIEEKLETEKDLFRIRGLPPIEGNLYIKGHAEGILVSGEAFVRLDRPTVIELRKPD